MAIAKQHVRADADLVRAAREGDKDAFGALVDRHEPMVVAVVQRLLANPTMAADAAQEAAVTALLSLSRLRSPERFGAWYAGVALNIGRRWLRGARPTTTMSSEWPDDEPGPEELAVAADLAKRVRDAVRGLPRGQREAVLAFYWKGSSPAAAELAVSPEVKARLHQASASMEPELAVYIRGEKEVLPVPETGRDVWVDVEVSEVRRSEGDEASSRAHAVILKETRGERVLPILIGPPEAVALACSLESVETPRPMTYQFAADLARAGGSTVGEVRITRLSGSMFYGVVVLQGPGGLSEVDSRPSDALNLAQVCNVPVRVKAALFDDPKLTRRDFLQAFPTQAPALAAEITELRDKQLTQLGFPGTEATKEDPA